MEVNPLIPLGSIIKVEKYKVKNVRPKNLLDDLPQIINAEIIDCFLEDLGESWETKNKPKNNFFND